MSGRTAGLDLPALVVTGDRDKVLGLQTAFRVAGGLADAEIQVVTGGGHLAPLERPRDVAALVARFLAERGWSL